MGLKKWFVMLKSYVPNECFLTRATTFFGCAIWFYTIPQSMVIPSGRHTCFLISSPRQSLVFSAVQPRINTDSLMSVLLLPRYNASLKIKMTRFIRRELWLYLRKILCLFSLALCFVFYILLFLLVEFDLGKFRSLWNRRGK